MGRIKFQPILSVAPSSLPPVQATVNHRDMLWATTVTGRCQPTGKEIPSGSAAAAISATHGIDGTAATHGIDCTAATHGIDGTAGSGIRATPDS